MVAGAGQMSFFFGFTFQFSLFVSLNLPHAAILDAAILKTTRIFRKLRLVVIDEAHIYRGAFGSHVACVLRRLLRLCAHYGNTRLQFICCSATLVRRGPAPVQLQHPVFDKYLIACLSSSGFQQPPLCRPIRSFTFGS